MGKKLYGSYFKRNFDILAALSALFIVLPLLIILLPLISFSNRGPIFFSQIRPGMHGKLFWLIKLQTMTNERDDQGKLLPDSVRLTPIGRLIRSISLDELPQLINVLKGEMSIVGPRPLLPEYLPLYSTRQARRHEVRPGITGWAQVNGRNDLSWEEKFEFDVWYVDNISFLLDLRIVFKTIFKVVNREGINSADTVTASPFKGLISHNQKNE